MFQRLLTAVGLVGAAVMLYPFITGKDITGLPTSTASMDCDVIAKKFIGSAIELDYSLRKIMRFESLQPIERTDSRLICRGLAFIEGSPATFMRLTSTEQSSGTYWMEVTQAQPSDYTCDLLGQEITMKFSREGHGNLGSIMGITKTEAVAGKPPLHCRGTAKYQSGFELPIRYHFDGTQFFIDPY
jgi:hypothetical protein